MPHYFFDVRDGIELRDEEGSDLPDLMAARQRAVHEARNLAAEDVRTGKLNLKDRIEVRDEDDLLFVVTFRDAIAVEY